MDKDFKDFWKEQQGKFLNISGRNLDKAFSTSQSLAWFQKPFMTTRIIQRSAVYCTIRRFEQNQKPSLVIPQKKLRFYGIYILHNQPRNIHMRSFLLFWPCLSYSLMHVNTTDLGMKNIIIIPLHFYTTSHNTATYTGIP